MLSVKELIERHSDRYSEFRYYIPIIEKAERNELDHPDITIRCCASVVQGVSNSIVHRLNPGCDKKALEKLSMQRQVKTALICLGEHDDVVEAEFARGCETLIWLVETLRNTPGDIYRGAMFGRAVPKGLQSDRSLARLALNISEGLIRYLLASFFALQQPAEELIAYEDKE